MVAIGNDTQLPGYIRHPLQVLQSDIFSEAIVAGGAVRDLENGRPVKDVDCFVWSHGYREAELVDRFAKLFPGWPVRIEVPTQAADYCRMENVDFVVSLGAPHGWPPIQVIVMTEERTIEQALARHDFGLCAIATDGQVVYRTYQYTRDQEDKCFTLTRCRDIQDFKRSHRRFLKWSEGKYQGWGLRVPECFEQILKGSDQ